VIARELRTSPDAQALSERRSGFEQPAAIGQELAHERQGRTASAGAGRYNTDPTLQSALVEQAQRLGSKLVHRLERRASG